MRIHITKFLLLTLIALSFGAVAQNKFEQQGDEKMDNFQFLAAAESYTNALSQSDHPDNLKLKLARCYIKLNQPDKTSKWYGEIVNKDQLLIPEDKYQYAQALLSTGKIAEAKSWFEVYATENPDDSRATNYLRQLENQAELFKDSVLHTVKSVSFKSPAADFSPAFYKDGIVFVSSRNPSGTVYKWNESAFLDLYFSKRGSIGIYDTPVPFRKEINTNWHEGPVCFYEKEGKMAVTRNNVDHGKLRKSSDGITKLKLFFISPDKEGNWVTTEPFTYNSDEYSVGHPALPDDGSVIYFISDMPGGIGGTDLYVSRKLNGTWSKPENLGARVNTPGNELFPYLGIGNKLYFASNGHGGLGGLDIFEYSMDEDTLRNIGYPFNSPKDDFGYIANSKGEGYFSSNRNSTNGADNIYEFKSIKSLYIDTKVYVINANNREPIVAAKVIATNLSTGENFTAETGPEGYANLSVLKNIEYQILVTKPGYLESNNNFTPIRETERLLVRLDNNCLFARGKVTFEPGPGESDSVSVMLTNTVNGKAETLNMFLGQQYEFCTAPTTPYVVKMSKKNYFTKSIVFITEDKGDIQLEDVKLEKIVIDKAIRIENIYYDLGKWNIRADAARELDKLVKLLEDNPTLEIELSSHTDSRGSDASNLSLSDKRAQAAVDYVISKGIGSGRITAKGYGETSLLNKCSNGVACSESQHQANRRTEFKVLKY